MAITSFPNGISTTTIAATTITGTSFTGAVVGDVTGAITGNVTGNLTGNVTGNVTGNLTGNVTGNVTGGNMPTVVTVSADGAITVPSFWTTYKITKAGVAAMTLAAPSGIDGCRLMFVSTTANAHTLTATGILNASSTTATWGGAVGDTLELMAMGVKWMVINTVNVTIT